MEEVEEGKDITNGDDNDEEEEEGKDVVNGDDNDEEEQEDTSENDCFFCKDGGDLILCDHQSCCKAYHAKCVVKGVSSQDTDEEWICDWHTCFVCQRDSNFQCFSCPTAVCKACIRDAEFAHLRNGKGFCRECVSLCLMIEENRNIDSDGEEVDFKDSETLEYLFKAYWAALKLKEHLTVEDLVKANSLLRKGKVKVRSRKELDDEFVIDDDNLTEATQSVRQKSSLLKCKQAKKVKMARGRKSSSTKFVGWGTSQLMQFLGSFGINTENKLSPEEVLEILHKYIHENKLTPRRRSMIVCDARMYSLFRKKKISHALLSKVLEAHFVVSVSDDEDNIASKRQRKDVCERNPASPHGRSGNSIEVQVSPYACISKKNIIQVYLRRSLIKKFLQDPDLIEHKVKDCFVKIKTDTITKLGNFHQLVQVTGTKKAPEKYNVDEVWTDVILLVSGVEKDVFVNMVSDDDLVEDDCKELHHNVRHGASRRPTVEELSAKAMALHEEIMKHRIEKEIVTLRLLIDRANEKGWRKEKTEYLDKLLALQKPEEQEKFLRMLPAIVAEVEKEEEESDKDTTTSDQKEKVGGNPTDQKPSDEVENGVDHEGFLYEKLWMYIDPEGEVQGPVSLDDLGYWYERGFFPDDFKIWKVGQGEDTSFLLTDLLYEVPDETPQAQVSC